MQSDSVSSSAPSPLGAPPSSTSSPSQTPAPAPSLPPALTSIVSPSGYTYPPIFSFPPFFTPQPNALTLAHQLSLWTALVLSWARWHRVFELRAEDVGGADVWENKPLKRKAGRDFQRSIMQALVQGGQSLSLILSFARRRGILTLHPHLSPFSAPGQATSLPPLPPKNSKDPPTAILLYWVKPEEWAAQIYDWVRGLSVAPPPSYRRKLTPGSFLHFRYQAPGRRTLS